MNAKVKKEFVLCLGSNAENMTEEDLCKKAFELEYYGNHKLGIRVHIS